MEAFAIECDSCDDVHARQDALSRVLRDTHIQNLAVYKKLLACEQQPAPAINGRVPFWDVVVVTAGDTQQRLVYERRIDQKLDTGAIPQQAKYHVIEDPPSSKIGSGGSTFLAMKVLSEIYPQEILRKARILLIHAGGYSTRLPHVSARGKVFTTLPQADSHDGIQVLDLKLVLYLHLLRTMPPGVFLTSADGIELFASKSPFPCEPKPLTITALAHPSSLHIGRTHGVYMLEDPSGLIAVDRQLVPAEQSALLLKCGKFLHKPSLDMMQSTPNVVYPSSTKQMADEVYTDSCYYFDPETVSVMARTYRMLPRECDLEAWADILNLQDSSLPTYTSNSNTDPHLEGRQIVQQALQESGVSLEVMVLNASKFYHLGTMEEFVAGVCTDSAFMSELNISNDFVGIARVESLPFAETISKDGGGCGAINPPVYIENSSVSSAAFVDPSCIIVDCDLPAGAFIPTNTCMFTLQLQEHEFTTFTFSVLDEMKKEATVSADAGPDEVLRELEIFGCVPVSEIVGLPVGTYPPGCTGSLSLWTAPVFEITQTKEESVKLALDRLHRIRSYLASGTRGGDDSSPSVTGWTSLKVAARRAREYQK
ncbi:L-fucokinase-domain-containing protein [Dissophora ornata]|nr:L-fucokinase-domain-containing protein [Dissophora ornata]